jgi:transposase-like protein
MSSRKRTESTDRRQFWRRTVKAWKSSGLPVRQFCRREGVSEPSFYSWRKKLAQRQSRPSGTKRSRRASTFIEVSLPDAGAAPLELVLRGGAILRIAPGTDAALFQHVLSILQEAGLC